MLKSYLNSVVLALALTPLVAAADVDAEERLIHELNTTLAGMPDACLDASPGYATPTIAPTAAAKLAQTANDSQSDHAAAHLTPALATVVADACIDASGATLGIAPRIAAMQ